MMGPQPFSFVVLACVLFAPGCIVLGDPQYREPERTPPRLRRVSPVEPAFIELQDDDSQVSIAFRVTIESEDLGEPVRLVLLEDLGRAGDTRPYEQVLASNSVAPGSLREGQRSGVITWEEFLLPDTECRRVTLLATHEFDGREPRFNCPLDPNDVDTLTWFVARCRSRGDSCNFDDCLTSDEEGITCASQDPTN